MADPEPGDLDWPDFLVIGAPKGGTTSVRMYLDRHPGISIVVDPDVDPNHAAPGYFSNVLDAVDAGERAAGEARRWYTDLVARASGTVGDVTPSYLWHHEAPRRIHEAVPDARLVCLLRDPVERAFSHYRMNVGRGGLELDFGTALDEDLAAEKRDHRTSRYVQPGRYAEHLRRYLDRFDGDQLLVLFTEEMGRDTDAVLRRIVAHVGADPDGVDRINTGERFNRNLVPAGEVAERIRRSDLLKRVARAVLPRSVRDLVDQRVLMRPGDKPELPPDQAARLVEIYRDEVHDLVEMLDREPPWDAERWDL